MVDLNGKNALGKTGLLVPRIGLGTAPFGSVLFSEINDRQAVETVHFALENGVTLIDTAPAYGNGLSEERVGLALQGVPRESFILSTKVGRVMTPDGKPLRDFSREGVIRSLHDSLKRLRLDRVDILHIHDPYDNFQEVMAETYPTVLELQRQGLTRAVSVGISRSAVLVEFANSAPFDCFMFANSYHLVSQDPLEAMTIYQSKGIPLLMAGVYAAGILATGAVPGAIYNYRPASPEVFDKVVRIEAVCRQYKVALRSAALQFVQAHPAGAALVVGAQSAQQMAETLQAVQEPIPAQFWQALIEQGLIRSESPLPGEVN